MRLRHLHVGLAVVALCPSAALASWSPPVTVSPRGNGFLGAPDGAVTASGDALVAWVRRAAPEAVTGRIEAAWRHGPRRRWVTGRLFSGEGASAPRVTLNPRGDAVIAWISGRAVVAAVRRGPTGSWTVSRVTEVAVGVQEFRVAIGPRGAAVAMWSERRGSGFSVRVSTRPAAGGPWSIRPAQLVTPGPAPPALALSPGAGALVGWIEGGHMRTARTVAGAFEPEREVSEEDAAAPAVALAPAGAALASWGVALPGGSSVVLGAGRARSGMDWASSEDLGIGRAPRAALNDRGDAVVAWSLAGAGAPQGIEASTRRRGGEWQATTVVPRRTCECALMVGRVAIDGSGTALVGWRRDDGAGVGGGGAAAGPAGGAEWLRADVLPGRTRDAPAVSAADGEGGIAVWAEEGPRGGVHAALLAR